MKRFTLGDPHGSYKAILQVFGASDFNYKKDQLICLGDVADGWPQVVECFEELLKIKNLIYIKGNHDAWLLDYFQTGNSPHIWTSQGGNASISSYLKRNITERCKLIKRHRKLLEEASPYYVTNDNKLFVHGGFSWHRPIKEQEPYDLYWDRNLLAMALYWQSQGEKSLKENRVRDYEEVFVGHTTTSRIQPDLLPVHASNVWGLDQGAGFEGKLTLMNIDTKEYFQSSIVSTLYPDEKGRR
jgi:serine/threonine protein phosphatase 1